MTLLLSPFSLIISAKPVVILWPQLDISPSILPMPSCSCQMAQQIRRRNWAQSVSGPQMSRQFYGNHFPFSSVHSSSVMEGLTVPARFPSFCHSSHSNILWLQLIKACHNLISLKVVIKMSSFQVGETKCRSWKARTKKTDSWLPTSIPSPPDSTGAELKRHLLIISAGLEFENFWVFLIF